MYTCNDNLAVVTCAKLWHDSIIIFHIWATWYFYKTWIVSFLASLWHKLLLADWLLAAPVNHPTTWPCLFRVRSHVLVRAPPSWARDDSYALHFSHGLLVLRPLSTWSVTVCWPRGSPRPWSTMNLDTLLEAAIYLEKGKEDERPAKTRGK